MDRILRASHIHLITPPRIEFFWAERPSFSKALAASVRVRRVQASKPEYRPEAPSNILC